MFLRVALLVLRKDFAIELKTGEILSTTLVFAIASVLIFAIAFVRGGEPIEGAAPGILWMAVAFSGTLALGRVFERERYGETLRALLLAPASRPAIYVGKLLSMIVLMLVVEALIVPMIAVLFQSALFSRPFMLAALLMLGTIGYASVGTLFAAMLVRARTRNVMLPILLYPVTIPVIIAGVMGTSALLQAPPDEPMARMWMAMLASFDVVMLTLALWTFEPLMTD
jgi:heme exporter protein B